MKLTFDSFLEKRVGALGVWHILVFLFISFCCTPPLAQYQQLALITPRHICSQPKLEAAGWSFEAIRNATVPRKSTPPGYDSCHQYNVSTLSSNFSADDLNDVESLPVIPCQHGWLYDDSEVTLLHSLPREFDLVCDKKMLVSWCGTAYMLGMIPGPAIAGFFADRFGRRTMSIIMSVIAGGVAIATSYLPNGVTAFWILRFLTGCVSSAANVVGYIWCAELTTIRHQNAFNFAFNFAAVQLADALYITSAFFLREWRAVHAVSASPHLLTVFLLFFVPESPRWLLAVGKRKQSAEALRRIASANRLCSCRTAKRCDGSGESIEAVIMTGNIVVDECNRNKEDAADDVGWQVLFTHKLYLVRLTLLLYLWIAVNIDYYSLFFFAVRLKGNPFVTAASLTAFGLFASFLKTVAFVWIDRKKALAGALFLSCALTALCAITLHLYPGHVINVVLSIIAFGIACCVLFMLYTIVPGLFPTATQNFAMGICYGVSRIGGALANFIEKLDTVTGWKWMPMAVLSMVMGVAFIATLILPLRNEVEIVNVEEASIEREDDGEVLLANGVKDTCLSNSSEA